MVGGVLYILSTIILVLAYPIIQQLIRREKWNRVVFYIYVPFAVIYVVVTVFIVLSSHRTETTVQTLENQELLLRDLRVRVCYTFRLAQDAEDKGGRIMGLSIDGGFVDTHSNTGDVLRMYTDYEYDIAHPRSRALEASFEFIPVDQAQVLNRPVSWLEKYDMLVLPYEAILRTFVGGVQGQWLGLEIKVLVNGRVIAEYVQDGDVPAGTKNLHLAPEGGLFRDIEKLYLESPRFGEDAQNGS